MLASDSSDEGVTASLLGKRTASSPPAAMRSSKSVISQVKDTLFSFIKRSKLDSSKEEADTDQNKENHGDDTPSSLSEKQRSLEAFTDRIKSFTVQNWMGKPLCLSPPLLAQYGWQCIGTDTLKCCSCSAVFGVRLPWPSAGNYREQCYKYRQKVLTAHLKICSWPSYPCADSFVSPFLHGVQGAPEVIVRFIGRRNNLVQLGRSLPKMHSSVFEELNLSRKDLQILAAIKSSTLDQTPAAQNCDNVENSFSDLSDSETASVLAMCGWNTGHSFSSRFPTVLCESSGRTIGLHNFFAMNDIASSAEENVEDKFTDKLIPDENRASSNSIESRTARSNLGSTGKESSSTSPIKREKQFFHPLQQHCPWSHWIAVLKPITKDEFEDDTNTDNGQILSEHNDTYEYVVNALIPDAKPGWHMVMNVLLGKRGVSERSLNKPTTLTDDSPAKQADASDDAEESPVANVQRTPPRSAVAHVRKLLKEWSSPK